MEKQKLKRLYYELKILLIIYRYLVLYYEKDLSNKEKHLEQDYVKKLVLKKKFYGKDYVVS